MKIGVVAVFFFCLLKALLLPLNVSAGLTINEFSPASSPEWVELYNPDDSQFSLNDISIYFSPDINSPQKLSFCPTDQISGKSFRKIILSSNWLANAGDTLMLKTGDDVTESITYGTGGTVKSPLATQSAFRSPDGTDNWILGGPSLQGDETSFNCVAPTPSSSQLPAALVPEVNITLDGKKFLDEKFAVKIEAKNFPVNTPFYAKLRGGIDEGSMSKARTQNNDSWLSDSESWGSFPIITTDNNGFWAGEIYGMVDGDKEAGGYKFRVRLRNKNTESNYDSQVKAIEIVKPTPVVTSVPTITLESKPRPTIDITPPSTKDGEILGTVSALILPVEAQKVEAKVEAVETTEDFSPVLITVGGTLSFLGIILFLIVKYKGAL